ncbi:MAG TPA: hypothetical protein VMU51_34630 [Mycobacteriales bacterium]|nr:hypothetical protein [Mycobacteriales bacterium]
MTDVPQPDPTPGASTPADGDPPVADESTVDSERQRRIEILSDRSFMGGSDLGDPEVMRGARR